MAGDRGSLWLSWPVAAILGLIVLARCSLVAGFMARSGGETWINWVMAPDSRDYVYMAEDLADGRLDSISFRTPLYPLLIAFTQHLLARRWLATILSQQLAVALTALACGAVANAACGRRAATMASISYLLCPLALIESTVVLPDTILALTVSWAGVLWLGALSSASTARRLAGAAVSGLLLGAGTLVKPSVFLLFLVPLVQLLFVKGTPGRNRFRTGIVLAACALCLPFAWRVHNLVRFGSPFLTTQDSFEIAARCLILSGQESQDSFWLSYVDSVEQEVIKGPIIFEDLACTRVPNGWAGLGGGRFCPSIDVERRDSLFRSIALTTFRSAPLRIIVGNFDRWPWFLANPVGDLGRAGGPQPVRSAVRVASMALQILLALGAAVALALPSVRKRSGHLLVFAALTFLVIGVVTGQLAGTRYSLPFYWVLVAVASCGWTGLMCGRKC
jgi:4-amino-4-deoxy-L-arabinose transferase-like glycosyltransferase